MIATPEMFRKARLAVERERKAAKRRGEDPLLAHLTRRTGSEQGQLLLRH